MIRVGFWIAGCGWSEDLGEMRGIGISESMIEGGGFRGSCQVEVSLPQPCLTCTRYLLLS